MSSAVQAITFDASNARVLGEFWSAVLDRPLDAPMPGAGDHFASIGRERSGDSDSAAMVMMFIDVPEGKQAKNRVHLDLSTTDRAAEVERLVALGATLVHEKDEWGLSWTTLADPEGNEFCVADQELPS